MKLISFSTILGIFLGFGLFAFAIIEGYQQLHYFLEFEQPAASPWWHACRDHDFL